MAVLDAARPPPRLPETAAKTHPNSRLVFPVKAGKKPTKALSDEEAD
jgi:hypothetical protein